MQPVSARTRLSVADSRRYGRSLYSDGIRTKNGACQAVGLHKLAEHPVRFFLISTEIYFRFQAIVHLDQFSRTEMLCHHRIDRLWNGHASVAPSNAKYLKNSIFYRNEHSLIASEWKWTNGKSGTDDHSGRF